MKPEHFQRFGDALYKGFADVGIFDVTAVVQGSGATNRSHESGRPFDEGRVSDYDVTLVSPTLARKAEQLGIKLSGPLTDLNVEVLGLTEIRLKLSQMTERPVNFLLSRGIDIPSGIWVP